MEDERIMDLYWQRDERAIPETVRKYGAFCAAIAGNVLPDRRDAEECVNDTWLRAWEAMPPQRPRLLRPFLGRITRNLALHLWEKSGAQKRGGGMTLLLDELAECVPSASGVEEQLGAAELGRLISAWLRTLPADDRRLFLRRYWNGLPLQALAAETGQTSERLVQRMYRLRQALKAYLERNGVTL